VKSLLALVALLLSAAPAVAAECPRLLDHRYTTLQGGQVNLCDYTDRAILVVNTASKCGFTPQFEKLEGLCRKYKDKGLMVVGFPTCLWGALGLLAQIPLFPVDSPPR
jgi:glutathione peroxidase